VITEGGYASVQNGQNGVDAPTQAILLLNYFLDAFAMGVPNTYTYELYDNGWPDSLSRAAPAALDWP
jgi:hypothetical protein